MFSLILPADLDSACKAESKQKEPSWFQASMERNAAKFELKPRVVASDTAAPNEQAPPAEAERGAPLEIISFKEHVIKDHGYKSPSKSSAASFSVTEALRALSPSPGPQEDLVSRKQRVSLTDLLHRGTDSEA